MGPQVMESYKALAYLNKTRKRANLELKYERLYKAMEDSIANISTAKTIADLEQKNVDDAKVRSEEVSTAQKAEKDAKTKLASYLTIAGIIVAAALAAIGLIFMFFQRKLRAQTKKNKAQQNRFAGIVRAQELEKIGVVTQLHDHVEEQLGVAQKQLSNMMEMNDSIPDTDDLLPILSKIKSSKESASDVGFAMLPKLLLDKGIAPALQELIKRSNKANSVEISFRSTPLHFSLAKDAQVIIYRTVHDILHYIIRFEKADLVDVFINQENKHYVFQLNHNGLGKEEEELKENEDLQWDSILSKMNFLGGKLKVIKKEPRGNEFKILIPEAKNLPEEVQETQVDAAI